jgi:hypothetical protein
VVFTVAALLPEQHQCLPSKLDGHELKHYITGLMEAAEIMNSDWWYEADSEADSEADYEVDGYGGTTPTSRLRDLFVVLPKGGLGDLIDGKEAKQYYKELRLKHQQHQHLQENPERDIFLGL